MPTRVTLVEVGPRDGFQMESAFIPTSLKVEVIDAIADAGVRKIEATSFVSPTVVPQMRDAAEVMARVGRRPGVTYSALVPNLRGAEAAMDAGVDVVRLVVCVTESYNQRNVAMSVEQSLDVLEDIVRAAAARRTQVEVALALSFGCPLEGAVAPERVVAVATRVAAMGVGTMAVADSIGVASPRQVAALIARLRAALPSVKWTAHLHDTRGMGLANAVVAMSAGVIELDASIGGLGGCPVVRGATGNLSSEDLVHMLHAMGIETGIDLMALMRATEMVGKFLGRSLASRVLQAGTTADVFARAARRAERGAMLESSTY